MINFIKNFRADEDGAVTVDWVVLTAAVVGLGVAGVATVRGSVQTLATNIASGVTGTTVGAGTTTTP
ncbi:Flp family type IVb pilin [Roseovarius aquimarinus]|uniref:Flp family type IVb pilin n=1 Tax=Roseovarius aquimarinus TaxID=1229156 RepID=A0ABW7I9P8_9RHOB